MFVAGACGCGGPSLSLGLHALWGLRAAGWVRGVAVPGGGLGGGGGRARYPPFVRPGGACRAGGRSASFRPSAFPGQATKRVSLVSCCKWVAWPPIPLRFVLTRLLWAQSVRRTGAFAPVCMFSAAPVGASGCGEGAGRAPAPISSGGGTIPPASGGGNRGPRGLRAGWGGGGGGSRRGLPAPLLGGGLRYSILAPLVSSAHSFSACACSRGRSAAPGRGGLRGGPWTALSGAPADLNPPSALGCGHGRVMWDAAPILFWCARCSGTLVWARPAAATLAGAGPAASPPPPRRGPFWGGGGRPLGSGGAEGRFCGSLAGGGAGGGAPPRPPAPSGVGLSSVAPGVPPRGILVLWGSPGGRGRRARSGRPPTGQCGGGGGGRGGNPPALVRAPVFPGPASDKAALFAPSWTSPVRRGPQQAGRVGACPRPWCPRTPGAAASSVGVWGCRFFGLPLSALGPEWEWGEGVGGALWSPGATF